MASVTNAFPGILDALQEARSIDSGAILERQTAPDPSTRFNAQEQYVSTSGEHAFVAPNLAGGDQRGPCPGLNAMGVCYPSPGEPIDADCKQEQTTGTSHTMVLDLTPTSLKAHSRPSACLRT